MDAPGRILACALDVGESMLICGGEVARVEDTISRILYAYGAQRADIFTITSSIVATLDMDGQVLTQTRRIFQQQIDFDKLDKLNALSRQICRDKPDCAALHRQLEDIARGPRYGRGMMFLTYALVAAAFSLFFGGSFADALASALTALALKALMDSLGPVGLNPVLASALYAFAGGAVAVLALSLGLGDSFDKIAIGDIMLLIPGAALTNALRDLLSGDTISGLTRLVQAVLAAIAVATGFALARGWLL